VRLHKIVVAERLLSLVTDRDRAASTIGDLLEDSSTHGSFWLWRRLAIILFSRIWSPIVALVISTVALIGGLWAVNTESQTHLIPPVAWRLAILALWALVAYVYCICRYGVRDYLTQLTVVLAAVGMVGICYGWLPRVGVTATVAAATIVSVSGLSSGGRRALCTLTVSLIISCVICSVLLLVWMPSWNPQHPRWSVMQAETVTILIVLTEAIALSLTRRTFLGRRTQRCR
jgi:hypothetical protein